MSFARRHPALSVIGVAGAGLLAGPELALGVVLGAGVAVLIDRRAGGRVERLVEEEAVRRAGGRVERVEEEAVDTARSVRRRARQIFDAEAEIVKQRARAVVQAARGQILPTPPTAGESPSQAESQAAHSSGL
jgi:hypothetical protein